MVEGVDSKAMRSSIGQRQVLQVPSDGRVLKLNVHLPCPSEREDPQKHVTANNKKQKQTQTRSLICNARTFKMRPKSCVRTVTRQRWYLQKSNLTWNRIGETATHSTTRILLIPQTCEWANITKQQCDRNHETSHRNDGQRVKSS